MAENVSIYDDSIPIGAEFPPYEYELTPEKVQRYLEAVQDTNPLYHDAAAAAESEFGGLIAPPTIAATYVRNAYREVATSVPGTVHAKQAYRFFRPQRPGDRLRVSARLEDRYQRKGRTYVIILADVTNQDGEKVLEAKMTIFLPGAPEAQ